nr:hypothetical protein [Brucella anthropi]
MGDKWTFSAAALAAMASVYSAYFSGSTARDSATAAANSNIQIASFEKQTNDRNSDIEMVKLALNILGGEISDKTLESRHFAVSLLRRYSGVDIGKETGSLWAAAGTVSFAEKSLGLSPVVTADPDIARIQRLSESIIGGMLTERLKKEGADQIPDKN